MKTVACDGTVVELGPSHHLSSHVELRALLAYGVPSSPEKTFGRSDETLACEERGTELQKLASIAREEREALFRGVEPSRECVPWADETAAFTVDDAVVGARVSEGSERLTARLGYQETFSRVRRRLKKDEGVRFITGTTVTSLRRLGHGFRAETATMEETIDADAVVLACPPDALRRFESLPGDVVSLIPSALETIPVASRRTVLCFRRVPTSLSPLMKPGTHFTSDADGERGFRWAVVLSPTTLMLSYVDGTRAEMQLRGEVSTTELAESFLASQRRRGALKGCLTAEELVENAVVHAGGSFHAFHANGTSLSSTSRRISAYGVGAVFLVGEAHGPVSLRAWMEGACASAAEVAAELNAA